jgi:hypothetical protein
MPNIFTLVVYTFRNKQSSEVGRKKFSSGCGHAAPSSVAFWIPCHGSIGTGAYENKTSKIIFKCTLPEKLSEMYTIHKPIDRIEY